MHINITSLNKLLNQYNFTVVKDHPTTEKPKGYYKIKKENGYITYIKVENKEITLIESYAGSTEIHSILFNAGILSNNILGYSKSYFPSRNECGISYKTIEELKAILECASVREIEDLMARKKEEERIERMNSKSIEDIKILIKKINSDINTQSKKLTISECEGEKIITRNKIKRRMKLLNEWKNILAEKINIEIVKNCESNEIYSINEKRQEYKNIKLLEFNINEKTYSIEKNKKTTRNKYIEEMKKLEEMKNRYSISQIKKKIETIKTMISEANNRYSCFDNRDKRIEVIRDINKRKTTLDFWVKSLKEKTVNSK